MTTQIAAGASASADGSGNVSAKSELPIKEVLVELWQNMEKLLRQEAALASAELDLKARTLKTEVITATVGGAVLYAGLLALVAAAILLLAMVMAAWVAALIVGVVAAGAGMMMLRRKPRLGSTDVAPTETLRTVRDDVQSFKEAIK